MVRVPPLPFTWVLAIVGFLTLSFGLEWVPWSEGVLIIIVLCMACEFMDSSLGMGYGTTLTPVLLAMGYAPLELVPTILVSELLSGFSASFFHHGAGNVDLSRGSGHLRSASILAACSVVGVLLGVELAFTLSKDLLKTVIGVIIISAGIWILLQIRRPFAYRPWKILGLGIVASFNKAVSGGGYGPLLTSGQILSGTEGRAAIGITSFAEAFTCLGASVLFLLKGQHLHLDLLIPVASGALLSVPFSAHVVRRTSEMLIKRLIALITIALGLFTLFCIWL